MSGRVHNVSTAPGIVANVDVPTMQCLDPTPHAGHDWQHDGWGEYDGPTACPGRRPAVLYTDPARVVDIVADDDAPRSGRTVSGYGGRVPTRYRVRYRGDDGRARWHRVKVMVYGNGGSPYVVAGGAVLHLDTDTEHGTMARGELDERYAVTREGTGDPGRPYVARFVGEHVATCATAGEAWCKLADAHERRMGGLS